MAEQQLPEGFTAATRLPEKYRKLFGDPENLLGYRLVTEKDPRTNQTYTRLAISQKGAYGDAVSGSSVFGAAITEEDGEVKPVRMTEPDSFEGYNGDDSDKTTYTAPDGRIFTDLNSYNAYIAQQTAEAERKRREGESAFALLFGEFDRYGLGALVEPLKNLIVEGLSRDEMTLRLRQTDAYQKRFAANSARINKGLRALSEAEYIGLEDQYQNIMRNYGLPQTYYSRGDMGRQEGFERFIGADVSPAELEDRVQTAYNRVINANPEVAQSLRSFYPDITDGDILAYALDPDKALTAIQRKVTAAEIGAGAAMAGLGAGRARAEELGRFGVTGEQARQGFSTIAEFLPSAQKLSDIYSRQGLGPYTQETAEQEVFGITGAAEAGRKRRKLTELETAAFSGTSGIAGGALARDRAGAI